MKRRFLMTPGPSPVPSFVRESLGREIMHHRTEEFQNILSDVHKGLKRVFCTDNPVLILASSGTGAMEAAVSNLFSRNDKVITVNGGKFGERWNQIAKSFSLEVIELKLDWGTSLSKEVLAKALKENKGVKGVFTTLCETSTATVYDVKAMAEVTRENDALLIVDAVSGLGQDRLLTDSWGVDVVVSGSQKGFMLPPGLSFISLSKKAQAAISKSDLSKYYFNLNKALKSYEKNDTPFTPAVSLVVGLKEALEMINSQGIEARWKRFEKMALATREAAKAIGLEIFSKSPSSSVTAICVPEAIKSGQIVKILRKDYGLSIAGGQDQMKDKIIRIAHMGWISEQDLISCFSLLEKVLKDLGAEFSLGASLARLEEVLYG
ncbi:MAG: alanine--glyoxylate aminotransferase family protein [Candidatus Omnitrophica bacterium]|nr:alanine--glyoxylate aminotransferase family protein [Candidatus Omnitrophota bacterium]MDD5430007.1 alanine--glyoxylate aminotransferase family protein [Candidatus Omnitrophota bacterium]